MLQRRKTDKVYFSFSHGMATVLPLRTASVADILLRASLGEVQRQRSWKSCSGDWQRLWDSRSGTTERSLTLIFIFIELAERLGLIQERKRERERERERERRERGREEREKRERRKREGARETEREEREREKREGEERESGEGRERDLQLCYWRTVLLRCL